MLKPYEQSGLLGAAAVYHKTQVMAYVVIGSTHLI